MPAHSPHYLLCIVLLPLGVLTLSGCPLLLGIDHDYGTGLPGESSAGGNQGSEGSPDSGGTSFSNGQDGASSADTSTIVAMDGQTTTDSSIPPGTDPTDGSTGADTASGPTGSNDAAGLCDPGGSGGNLTSTQACNVCLGTNCCAQVMACANDPSCPLFVACLTNCIGMGGTAESCAVTCYGSNMSGATTAEAILTCTESNCAQPCAGLL